jgi:glycosyltransferase involved in cell wall biosynthesis
MSYLETYSANYAEAIARKKPLLVSDFDFLREICGDSALYVHPNDYNAVARKLDYIINFPELSASLVKNGEYIQSKFLALSARFNNYIEIITKKDTRKSK